MSTNNGMKEDSEKVLLRQELLNTQTQRFQLFTVSITVFIVALSFFLKDTELVTVEGMVLLLLLVPCGIIMKALRRRETKISGYIAIFCDANIRGWSKRNKDYMKKYYPYIIRSSTQGIMLSYLFLNIVVLVLMGEHLGKRCTIPGIFTDIFTVGLSLFNFYWILEMVLWPRKSSDKIIKAWERLKKDEETNAGGNQNSVT